MRVQSVCVTWVGVEYTQKQSVLNTIASLGKAWHDTVILSCARRIMEQEDSSRSVWTDA